MKKNKLNDFYVAPKAECIELHTEQCIAASAGENPGGDLGIMDPNDLVDDFLGISGMNSLGF